jgi:hypothetical protein
MGAIVRTLKNSIVHHQYTVKDKAKEDFFKFSVIKYTSYKSVSRSLEKRGISQKGIHP